jgi:hypothetical protein
MTKTPVVVSADADADEMNLLHGEYLTMLDDCEMREGRLNDWERGFVDSLRSQIEWGRRPSFNQIESLNGVWERAMARDDDA